MTNQSLKKVIKEKVKRRFAVIGLFVYTDKSSKKTITFPGADVPVVIDDTGRHLPDDIVRDVTPKEISDLKEE